MKSQPANVSPLWFFTKIGIICVLGVIVFVQVYAMRWKTPLVPSVIVLPSTSEAKKPKQAPQQKREQVKKADSQDATPKQLAKPSLTEAMKNPETYAMIKAEFKRRLDAPYGKLYRGLNLDAATLQKLRDLLADKELTLAEGFRLAEESGTPLSAEGLATLRNDSDVPIKELLGDDAFATYKYYESTLPARNHVNELEERLSYKSEPLTSAQYDALVSALSALPDPNINPDSGAWLGNYNPDITKESLEIARGILTQSQFAVYEVEYESTRLGQEMAKKYSKYLTPPQKNGGSSKNTK